LQQGHEGIADIERFLGDLRRTKMKKGAVAGCMMASALADGSASDSGVARRTALYEDRIRAAFEAALGRAVLLGEVDPAAPKYAAPILTAALIGALAASRTAPPRVDKSFTDAMLAMLDRWGPRKSS
jgi:AcrR family transcriptional regulator